MTCLTEQEILGFLHDAPSPEKHARVDAHIDSCTACHELILLLGPSGPAQSPRLPHPPSGDHETAVPGRGALIGRYVMIDLVGTGGMGVVYAAYDPELDRKVALKLLRSELEAHGPERLRREAQALARLAHPHVVSLHDVGVYQGRTFIVMEFVEGMTLSERLGRDGHGWRTRLELLLQAGRGLQAAHAAGLVHRDFKPSNVLIDGQGRARVLDFGLARAIGEVAQPVEAGPGGGPALSCQLTCTGMVLGTPAYMAPEQYRGANTDARTDQFSFCVVLYEALYGQRPFSGETIEELADATTCGRIAPPPREARVPASVQRAVLRGLSVNPAARFPAMADLLAALQRDPRVARRRTALAVAGAVLFGGGVLAAHFTGRPALAPCRIDPRWLHGTWDAERKRGIHDSFVRSGKPYAQDSFAAVSKQLDAYVADWTNLRVDACLATAVRREQSAELLDLRMQCLDERTRGVRALTELFLHADGQVVEKSVQAVYQLAAVDDCRDARGLLEQVRPPREAGQRAELELLRTELVAVQALGSAGKWAVGQPRAEALLVRAQKLGYLPLLGEVQLVLAEMQRWHGAYADAQNSLNEALLTAVAGGDERQAFTASVRQLALHTLENRFAPAESSGRYAEALLRHLGGNERLAVELRSRWAHLYAVRSQYPQAEREYQLAYEILMRTRSASDPVFKRVLLGMADVAESRGDPKRHRALMEQLLARTEASLGRNHPDVGSIELSLGSALEAIGDHAAFAHYRRGVEIMRGALPADHPMLANALGNLTYEFTATGLYAEAAANLQHVLSIHEHSFGHEHQEVAHTLRKLGWVYLEWGKLDRAAPCLSEALAIARRLLGPDHVDVIKARDLLGELAMKRHDYKEAIAQELAVLAGFKKSVGPESLAAVGPLEVLGQAYLRCAQPAKAVDALTRAVLLLQRMKPLPESPDAADLVQVQALLAKAQDARRGRAGVRSPALHCPASP